jgi:putative addiction module killer protein
MIDIREYQDVGGRSPYREWFQRLDSQAARKVTTAIYRVGLGNLSSTKSVGGGVFEFRINFGPGYRLYFGREGQQIVYPSRRRNKTTPAAGHRACPRKMERL